MRHRLHNPLSFSLGNFFQNSCYSKLEKADILELTVQHLKNLKSQQIPGRCASSEFINPLSKNYFQSLFLQTNSSGGGLYELTFNSATLQLKVVAQSSSLLSYVYIYIYIFKLYIDFLLFYFDSIILLSSSIIAFLAKDLDT